MTDYPRGREGNMPPRTQRRHFLNVKCLIMPIIVCCFVSLGGSADARIQITSTSNVALVSGYSIDLARKQELTPVGASFNDLLAALQGDLQDLFKANVEYLS